MRRSLSVTFPVAVGAGLLVGAVAATARADTIRVPRDFDSVQTALDRARDGDHVVVSGGAYLEEASVSGVADLRISFRRGAEVTRLHVSACPGAVVSGVVAQDVVLRDCEGARLVRVVTRDSQYAGIQLDSCDGARVVRSRAERAGGLGIVVSQSNDASVTRCSTVDCRLGIELIRCDESRVTRCTVSAPAGPEWQVGIGIDDGRNEITHCRVTGTDIALSASGREIVIARNSVRAPGWNGLQTGALGGTVEHNRLRDCDLALLLYDGSDVVVSRNRVVGGGVSLSDRSSGAQVDRNVSRGGAEHAYELRGSATVVTRNRAIDTGLDGFVCLGDRLELSGNEVTRAGRHGIVVEAGESSLRGNVVRKAAQVSFLLAAEDVVLTDNRASGSGTFDVRAELSGISLAGNDLRSVDTSRGSEARIAAAESLAQSVLRQLAAEQNGFRADVVEDADGDGIGQYGHSLPVLERALRRGAELPLLLQGNVDVPVQPEWATVRGDLGYMRDYIVEVFLPGEGGTALEGWPFWDLPAPDPDLAETTWGAYAWPVDHGRTGRRTFFIGADGVLTAADVPAYAGDGAIGVPQAGAALTPGQPADSLIGAPAIGETGRDGAVWQLAE